jgi:LemA protein
MLAAAPALARFTLIAVLLGVLLAGCGVNDIPTYEEDAKAKWAELQNQYQRRADLIPGLVEAARSAASQEREVLDTATAARTRAVSLQLPRDVLINREAVRQLQEIQQQLSAAIAPFAALAERYPALKANQNFAALRSQLEAAETRIDAARRDYSDAARRYNAELRAFPGVIWKALFFKGSKPMEVFAGA